MAVLFQCGQVMKGFSATKSVGEHAKIVQKKNQNYAGLLMQQGLLQIMHIMNMTTLQKSLMMQKDVFRNLQRR